MVTINPIYKDKIISELIPIKEDLRGIKNLEDNKYSYKAYTHLLKCIRDLQRSK